MRHGHIRLDLSTHEFLTHQQEEQIQAFNKLSDSHRSNTADSLLVRDGHADPKAIAHGAHQGGEPHRIARDLVSGKYFVKIADYIPADLNTAHLERRHKRITDLKPIHVPGEGYWIPLDELFPDHPHAKSEPIREAHARRA